MRTTGLDRTPVFGPTNHFRFFFLGASSSSLSSLIASSSSLSKSWAYKSELCDSSLESKGAVKMTDHSFTCFTRSSSLASSSHELGEDVWFSLLTPSSTSFLGRCFLRRTTLVAVVSCLADSIFEPLTLFFPLSPRSLSSPPLFLFS
jgi:hypothetical protein